MKPTIWLIVRGIAGNANNCLEWEQRAADWILQDDFCREAGYVARADSYSCSFLDVWIRQKERSEQFARVLLSYVEKGFAIRCIAHSNGTRVVRDGLKIAHWPRVEELHFVCGACDSDFHRTDFNCALKHNRIGAFYHYEGGRDWAMKIENTFLGKLDFAVPEHSQPMGLKGPRHVDPCVRSRVICRSKGWEAYGHSTCWEPHHFNDSMRRIVHYGSKTNQTDARANCIGR